MDLPQKPNYGRVFDPIKKDFVITKRTYTVWQIRNNTKDWKMYHCPDCRYPLVQYQGDVVMEIPGLVTLSYPTPLVQCKNPACGRKVQFQAVVDTE